MDNAASSTIYTPTTSSEELNFKALIICISVIGGSALLTVACCCLYCCCCHDRKGTSYELENARYKIRKMENNAKSGERRMERKGRLDDIRRKYGLMKETPYNRFDS